MAQRRFLVHGRVQGVGFRWWTRTQAERLGITGSVRNREDGAVEVRASGSDPAVAELRRLLAEGPPTARVDRVDESDVDAPAAAGFQIVH